MGKSDLRAPQNDHPAKLQPDQEERQGGKAPVNGVVFGNPHLEFDVNHLHNMVENPGKQTRQYTGLQVNLSAFAELKTVTIALAVTIIAIAGKALSGFAAGRGVNHALIGFGMVPRGEVGLIFINVGYQLGVVNDQIFAIVVAVVILTTLFTPPILSSIIRKEKAAAKAAA